jgi:hypothetical protein
MALRPARRGAAQPAQLRTRRLSGSRGYCAMYRFQARYLETASSLLSTAG